MSESAAVAQLRAEIGRREREEEAHKRTRYELQTELERVWGLVPHHVRELMGVYPPLKKLLAVLVDAAKLQDPSRGSPVEDTMRVEFVHTGPNASTSSTEAGVSTHDRHRSNVRTINREVEDVAHRLAKLIGGEEWQYQPPDDLCPVCDKPIFHNATGRKRTYCSTRCRVAASRKVEV